MFPNNPIIDAANKLLSDAAERVKVQHPTDSAAQIERGVGRAFAHLNLSVAVITEDAVVALYPTYRN